MKKILAFLKEMISVDGKVSSKRFAALYIILPSIIIGVFTSVGVEYVYALMGLFTALYGLTTVAKFAKK